MDPKNRAPESILEDLVNEYGFEGVVSMLATQAKASTTLPGVSKERLAMRTERVRILDSAKNALENLATDWAYYQAMIKKKNKP